MEALLYAVPMVVVGGVLWRASRRERVPGEEEFWEGADDPQWRDDWDDDPRLRDDD